MPSAKKRGKGGKKKGTKARGGNQGDGLRKEDAAAAAAAMTQTLSEMTLGGAGSTRCRHGCCHPVPPFCHQIVDAMRKFLDGSYDPDGNHLSNQMKMCEVAFGPYPEVIDDESARSVVQSFLTATGADILVSMKNERRWRPGDERIRVVGAIIFVVLTLEKASQRRTPSGLLDGNVVATEFFKVIGGGARDIARFFSKRIPCGCLKNLYDFTKKVAPKTGFCANCSKITERRLLRVCGNCRAHQYCSRECQVAHWQLHKNFCAKWAAEKATTVSDKEIKTAAAVGGKEDDE